MEGPDSWVQKYSMAWGHGVCARVRGMYKMQTSQDRDEWPLCLTPSYFLHLFPFTLYQRVKLTQREGWENVFGKEAALFA